MVLTKSQTQLVGMSSNTFTVATAGMHSVKVSCTDIPSSSVILTIAQSGSTSNTVSSPSPAQHQNHIDLQATLNCQVGDVITVTIASSSQIDNQLNSVKTLINIHQGSLN